MENIAVNSLPKLFQEVRVTSLRCGRPVTRPLTPGDNALDSRLCHLQGPENCAVVITWGKFRVLGPKNI